MIIGFDGSRAFSKKRTGTENYSYQLLKSLSTIDKKNQYIVYLRPGVEVGESWSENLTFKVISWSRLWTQGGLVIQTFIDDLDVLFIPSHTLPIISKPGLKTVMTVHDLGAEYLPKMHQLKQQLYLKYITRYQLTSATRLIAVSKSTKEDLVKKVNIDPKKITVVYEGYDTESYGLRSSKIGKYFLFVGTIQPRKNLTRLITAFSRVIPDSIRDPYYIDSDFRQNDKLNLLIVGSKGWASSEIYMLPKKLGIEGRVKFLGYVPDKDMPALYSNALALVFPSLFEGFGLPILEAQASGCPVITSNTSSMPEVAGKGAILVDPYSTSDIVKGMSDILNKEIRDKLTKAGFENIKRFSWEKCAKETLSVLEEI